MRPPAYVPDSRDSTETVRVLNEIISDIDESCEDFGVEKIKTIGKTPGILCRHVWRLAAGLTHSGGRHFHASPQ